MGWKCTPQLLGLVRGEPKPGQKHRANGLKICMEAGEERASKSKTLDRAKSKDNQYQGIGAGQECWDKMEADAEAYRVTGVNKNGKEFSRKLRGDAVIGWAIIFKPPEEVAAGWDEVKLKKFRNHSWDVMKKIEPRLFHKGNWRMLAEHKDEGGGHFHLIGDAKDEDGRYCGNLIDAALMDKINREYPAMMRKLGWDIEDVEVTDWARYKSDPEYRAAVDAKKAAGPGGLSVNDYMASQAAERAEAAVELYQEAQKAVQEAQEARDKFRGMMDTSKGIAATSGALTAQQRVARGLPKLPGE